MSGIRVPVISQIVSLGIKKGAQDMSPIVRKAAALAIPKCWRLDLNTAPQLTEYLGALLGDKQYFVAGAAVMTFMEVCPERIDLIHPHYRSLLRKLVDMDEWGQLATLRMMTIYARQCFPLRTKRVKRINGGTLTSTKGFYDSDEEEGTTAEEEGEEVTILDPDLEFLLKAAIPLLRSRNSGVIIAVSRCYLALSPTDNPTYIDTTIGPLISLFRSAQDIQQIALYNVVQVALVRPAQFVRHVQHFLVRTTDSPEVWRHKLELLTIIFPYSPPHSQSLILGELAHFCGSGGGGISASFVREAVRAIGRCAQTSAPGSLTATRCLKLLLGQIDSANGELVAEAMTVIRHLIQADPPAHVKTVIRLAKSLDTMTTPQARATIVWLVGEFAGINPKDNIAADVLRILAKGFADEAEAVKLQIVLLAAKVYVHHLNLEQQREQLQEEPKTEGSKDTPEGPTSEILKPPQPYDESSSSTTNTVALLWSYILLLARYDTSYDLRDRARVYRALLSVPSSTQLANLLLLAPKPVPQAPSPSESRRGFTLGSASLVIGTEAAGLGGLKGYNALPEWVAAGEEPEASLRGDLVVSGSGVKSAYGELPASMTASDRLDAQAGASAFVSTFGDQSNASGPYVEKSLDDWLAESEAESDSDEGSDAGAEEEEESEETDEESEEGESEEDDNENAKLVKS